MPWKRLDVLVEGMPRLSSAATSLSVGLVGVGLERDRLQAQDLGVSDQLPCLVFRSDSERFLVEAAVFVLRHGFEGMPNAFPEVMAPEVMAAGLPLILTDASPGPLAVVEPGVSALGVPSDDPTSPAAAMTSLASDSDRCKRMGDAARARIASFGWPQLEPLWQSLLVLS